MTLCMQLDQQMEERVTLGCLLTARFQASVCAYKGSLIAVGGTDAWNCLNSVEMYQPASNTWTYIASLGTIRRGAGIDVVGGEFSIILWAAIFFLLLM